MWNLVHAVAVFIGWALWQLSEDIVIAAVIAVIVEGIMLAIAAALTQSKATDEVNTEPIPMKPKRLWWRIALVAAFGILALIGVFVLFGIPVAFLVRGERITDGWSSEAIQGMITGAVFCIPIVFCIIGLKKALWHNKRLAAANGTAEEDAKND